MIEMIKEIIVREIACRKVSEKKGCDDERFLEGYICGLETALDLMRSDDEDLKATLEGLRRFHRQQMKEDIE